MQCGELAAALQTEEFSIAQKVELIVSSPMRRTIQTTQQGLGWLIDRGVPVILRAEWQENSDKACDTGSTLEDLVREERFVKPDWLDWSTVDQTYPKKTGLYRYTRQGLKERGLFAKQWLKDRPEDVIAVVSHSGFLRCGVSSCGYENADFRIFKFAEGEGEAGLELIEDTLTVNESGGPEKSGGLRKSRGGHQPMHDGDNIPSDEIARDEADGEVVDEKPPA